MTDTTQPEALRLANVCSNLTRYSMDAHLIAAELRRLHAENETLRMGYAAARLEIESLRAAQAAPAAVAGPNEAVKFTDQSTADPVEKARRYLTAMGGQRTDSAYFCDDGFPRRESAQDALATLAVLEQLAAAPTTQPAPHQEAQHLAQALTYPENQPNQYGVEFGMSGPQMHFKIGNQLFRLAYEPDEQEEFDYMKRMLLNAFTTFTHDVKTAPQPAPVEPPAPRGAPVAWLNPWRADQVTTDYDAYGERGIPLYTAPQQEAQEPVAWQSRRRPTWEGNTSPWSPWKPCTKEQAEDCWKTRLLNGWAYQARALYTAPQPSPVEQNESAYQRGYMDGMAKGRRDVDAAPPQEPSHTAVQLAELVLSDCGHSSNYTPLLDRVAARIDSHTERRLDELRRCLESNPAPQQEAQEPFAWHVCSVNSDGSLSLEHAAAWEEAAHEHINDAITEHDIEGAGSWVVRPAYHAPQPSPAAQGDALDAERLDWLLLRISGAEFRRIGVHYSGNARRADVDAARKQGANHD